MLVDDTSENASPDQKIPDLNNYLAKHHDETLVGRGVRRVAWLSSEATLFVDHEAVAIHFEFALIAGR